MTHTHLTLRADVSAVDTQDGMVLLDEAAGRYYQLNATGALVLRTLLDGADRDAAVTALTARHPVGAERAAADTDALLADLHAAGLVR